MKTDIALNILHSLIFPEMMGRLDGRHQDSGKLSHLLSFHEVDEKIYPLNNNANNSQFA